MQFINPPATLPPGMAHHTFYSRAFAHDLGYNIYLPPGYETGGTRYPVQYHLHGWQNTESTEILSMQPAYASGQAIMVFPNNSPNIESFENLPVEAMVIEDFIPHIDATYRTLPTRAHRTLSGFSMGGGMAFIYAVRHLGLFSRVIAYAATFHHYYDQGYQLVGEPAAKAPADYARMLREEPTFPADNILRLVRKKAAAIRDSLTITLRIGTDDPLLCDNEIMHMFMNDMEIPHTYVKVDGIGHRLEGIV